MSKQTFGMIVVALGCLMAVSAFTASRTEAGIDAAKVAGYLVLPTIVMVVGAWMWFSRPKRP
jgi:hypothetical protein